MTEYDNVKKSNFFDSPHSFDNFLNHIYSSSSTVVLAEKYRSAHLNNNPDYPQFIVGKDIAILRVDVVSARICNINDEVLKWNVMSGNK